MYSLRTSRDDEDANVLSDRSLSAKDDADDDDATTTSGRDDDVDTAHIRRAAARDDMARRARVWGAGTTDAALRKEPSLQKDVYKKTSLQKNVGRFAGVRAKVSGVGRHDVGAGCVSG